MDVPGHGTIQGEWDLRGSVDKYLGHFDFTGKRVLDVGAASGILSFYIEKKARKLSPSIYRRTSIGTSFPSLKTTMMLPEADDALIYVRSTTATGCVITRLTQKRGWSTG